jgi:hypothetical protein
MPKLTLMLSASASSDALLAGPDEAATSVTRSAGQSFSNSLYLLAA